ncbi:penicillin-binding transpeptidase domain-containing protein [Streptomyces sp. WI04-05B]|uniref:penicillin-binding transpeptidase domain-containing protein n=1 Tax=Streptomyces TaxID=1883 RepID=UPI0029A34A9B|nr:MULTISPECIES: penicillin-binding transpeptidase domain-containing protein [unclassified Streptomyces]MDX2544431.1 penicillin-binding transpeptidase domain-containing protein [Streptomyces sp. WI04-05B]MDX2588500.1 penicillin-binding transpeptidase domain-containing protein [Streptomyces sp. WI04-05A]MDX3750573.1 penicillin-binding transpeptidase domain-containing protein [Streptomyces sp. AK08-02]
MRKGAKAAIVGSVFTVMVAGAGYGAFNIVSALNEDSGGTESVKTGPPSKDEIAETSEKFFAAWEKGQAQAAAQLTDNAAPAATLIGDYRATAHITGLKITPGTATGATVPFSVKATVSFQGKSKPLAYTSSLTIVRGTTTGRALVDWKPSVVHPGLKAVGDTLVTGEAGSPPIEAVDRDGKVLTKEKYPSLGPILDTLRARYGDKAGGTPGVELMVRHADTNIADTSLVTLAEGTPGKLETTLSASAQAAAEKAVLRFSESSVVAVQPSTGEVLAVANHRKDQFNAAFEGTLAPGSTMKIVTAAMLIDNGVTSMNGPAPCTSTAIWKSQTFSNLKGMAPNENATLANDFLRSCNTGFIKLIDGTDAHPLTDESLTTEAQERFGLGQDNWKTGITSFDGSVPASPGPDRAANAIGQGQVQMSPLNMASVTATAITGEFRQPYLVSPDLDKRELATAKGLPASTSAQLKEMMRMTATQGTATQAMAGLSGDIGAKTGSAEVDGQAKSNSWFTGFRGDIAAAAMTQEGGHGGDAAGPIVAAVLRTGG